MYTIERGASEEYECWRKRNLAQRFEYLALEPMPASGETDDLLRNDYSVAGEAAWVEDEEMRRRQTSACLERNSEGRAGEPIFLRKHSN